MNPIKSRNLKKYLDLGAWDLETTFGNLGPEDIPAMSLEPWFQFPQTVALFSQES